MNSPKYIKFSFPIQEKISDSSQITTEQSISPKEFLIRGTAITETTTRNGHKFIAEELQKSAMTLRGKPLLKDHKNEIDSIVGKTTSNVSYDSKSKSIQFEASIHDTKIKEMINDGLINNVSVGAYVREYEDTDKKETILKGIDFVELSLVAVPADPNASFARADFGIAIAEAFKEEKMEEKIEEKSDELTSLREYKAKIEAEKHEAELRSKIEAEIRAKLEKEFIANTEVAKVERVSPKAQIVSETATKPSMIKIIGYDASTQDNGGFSISNYDPEMFKILGGKSNTRVI